jgi:hypothetical protein
VVVKAAIALQGVLGIGFVGEWHFVRSAPASAKIDSLPANIELSAPTDAPTAIGGLTLLGISGGVPNADVLAGAAVLIFHTIDIRNNLQALLRVAIAIRTTSSTTFGNRFLHERLYI